MLYRFIDENTIKICQQNGVINGRAISNLPRYFKNNPEIANAEGYKPLVTVERPEYDETTQYLTVKYAETSDAIIQYWVVNVTEQVEIDVEMRIAELEAELEEIKAMQKK